MIKNFHAFRGKLYQWCDQDICRLLAEGMCGAISEPQAINAWTWILREDSLEGSGCNYNGYANIFKPKKSNWTGMSVDQWLYFECNDVPTPPKYD